jgi:hypothetical protein
MAFSRAVRSTGIKRFNDGSKYAIMRVSIFSGVEMHMNITSGHLELAEPGLVAIIHDALACLAIGEAGECFLFTIVIGRALKPPGIPKFMCPADSALVRALAPS